jgi:frataxin
MSSPMLDDSQFNMLAEAALTRCFDALEMAYEDGLLEDLERDAELVTIVAETGETFIVSKHNANKELWLASPSSGGSHFGWDAEAKEWRAKSGQSLFGQLGEDLRGIGIEVTL